MAHENSYSNGTGGRNGAWSSRVVAWLTAHGGRAGDLLLQSKVVVAVAAMVKVATVMAVLSVPANAAPVIAFLVTFSIYVHNDLTDLEEDSINDPDGVRFVKRWSGHLELAATMSYALALGLALLGGPLALLLTLFPGVVGALYSKDLIRVGSARRLKEVLVVNTTVVAVAWAAVVALLPLAYAGLPIRAGGVLMFLVFVLRTFIAGELLNIRDVSGDAAAGVSTLPLAIGAGRTRLVLYALDALTLGLLAAAAVEGVVGDEVVLAFVPAILLSAFVSWRSGRTTDMSRLGLSRLAEYPLMLVCVLLVTL
ncbi:UbiA family prenyltransferase [Halobium salinum]|uniref:UbiA family prenyltransferase n=1 Tax=Halobium salinum TaxID=1364940 RepID=A0ABD5PEE0_9EURY|nr:UbiA family prenyltransferase [Halobium salinum]